MKVGSNQFALAYISGSGKATATVLTSINAFRFSDSQSGGVRVAALDLFIYLLQ